MDWDDCTVGVAPWRDTPGLAVKFEAAHASLDAGCFLLIGARGSQVGGDLLGTGRFGRQQLLESLPVGDGFAHVTTFDGGGSGQGQRFGLVRVGLQG